MSQRPIAKSVSRRLLGIEEQARREAEEEVAARGDAAPTPTRRHTRSQGTVEPPSEEEEGGSALEGRLLEPPPREGEASSGSTSFEAVSPIPEEEFQSILSDEEDRPPSIPEARPTTPPHPAAVAAANCFNAFVRPRHLVAMSHTPTTTVGVNLTAASSTIASLVGSTAAMAVTTTGTLATTTATTAVMGAPVLATGAGPSGGNGVPTALPALPAGVAATVSGRARPVNRARHWLIRVVNDLTDGLSGDLPVEVITHRLQAVAAGRAAHHDRFQELVDHLDDPATVTDDADRDRVVTEHLDRLADVERDILDIEAQAAGYIAAKKGAGGAGTTKTAKLPQIELLQFHGEARKWPEFIANFRSLVLRHSGLDETAKVSYLRTACKGDAARVVSRFQAARPNINALLQALEERFGRPDIILDDTFSAIDQLSAGSFSVSDNKKLLDTFIALLTTLETNGVNVNDPATTMSLFNRVKKKFRGDLLTAWHRRCQANGWLGGATGRFPTMDEFLSFAQAELQALQEGENARKGGGRGPPSPNKKKGHQNPRVTGTALAAGGATAGRGGARAKGKPAAGRGDGGRRAAAKAAARGASFRPANMPQCSPPGKGACGFCLSENHRPEDCPKAKSMTARERREALKNGCWRCLSPAHRRMMCNKPVTSCSSCGSDHHKLLHGSYDSSSAKRQ